MPIEPAPLSATEGRAPFFLEKWYVDLISDDGTMLIVLLGQIRALGLRRARLTAELHRPDGSAVRGAAQIGGIASTGSSRIFRGGSLEPEILVWETPNLSGELYHTARYQTAYTSDPLLIDGTRQLRWIVEMPDADVRGELRVGSESFSVTGRGYRDYLALDLLPWRVPLRHLEWGRAACGEHAAWWIRMQLTNGVIEGTWSDGTVMHRQDPPILAAQRVIQQGHVADLPVLRIGWLRSVLRRLARDPHLTRVVGRAHLEGTPGWAVQEVVRWR